MFAEMLAAQNAPLREFVREVCDLDVHYEAAAHGIPSTLSQRKVGIMILTQRKKVS
jgi:hypothetical protein